MRHECTGRTMHSAGPVTYRQSESGLSGRRLYGPFYGQSTVIRVDQSGGRRMVAQPFYLDFRVANVANTKFQFMFVSTHLSCFVQHLSNSFSFLLYFQPLFAADFGCNVIVTCQLFLSRTPCGTALNGG